MDVQLSTFSRVVEVGGDNDDTANYGEGQGDVRDDLERELDRIVCGEGVEVLEERGKSLTFVLYPLNDVLSIPVVGQSE